MGSSSDEDAGTSEVIKQSKSQLDDKIETAQRAFEKRQEVLDGVGRRADEATAELESIVNSVRSRCIRTV